MHAIKTMDKQLTEGKAADLMFTGFRQAERLNMDHAAFNQGPNVYAVAVKSLPAVGHKKLWSVVLYTGGEVVATALADQYDL